MDTESIKKEFLTWNAIIKGVIAIVGSASVVFGGAWVIAKPHIDKYIEEQIKLAEPPIEQKLSYKLANEIGADKDEVHKKFGEMYITINSLTSIIDSFEVKYGGILNTLIEKKMVDVMIYNGQDQPSHLKWTYISPFDGQPYPVRSNYSESTKRTNFYYIDQNSKVNYITNY